MRPLTWTLAAMSTFGLLAVPAGGVPASMTIVFEARPIPPPAPSGTFTASRLLCASGSFRDTNDRASGGRVVYDRILTCGDGSGTLTIHGQGTLNVDNGRYEWQIRAGTGSYASLRGQGTGSSMVTGPDTWRDTWQGIADFDDLAPSLRIDDVRATRAKQPKDAYTLRIALTANDNVEGNPVSYEIAVFARSTQLGATRSGQLLSGSGTRTVKVRPPKGVKKVRVAITVSDPLGNSRRATASAMLPAA